MPYSPCKARQVLQVQKVGLLKGFFFSFDGLVIDRMKKKLGC